MVNIVILVVLFVMSVVCHEVAHGAVAYIRGDRTAKDMGRLTLNPIKHIDLWGTILLPAMLYVATAGHFLIGMAKPVPVNFNQLRSPKRDMILVGFAGPLANIILAQFFVMIYYLTSNPIFLLAVHLNLILAAFNLFPIPPLDGSRVLAGLLPPPLDREYIKLERVGWILVLVLIFSGAYKYWLIPVLSFLIRFLHVPAMETISLVMR